MNHFEWNWTQEGLKLYGQGWIPIEVKGVVCIVHGFNEHSGRYADAAERLTKNGYAVLAHDQFGHGKTEGKRGHTPSYEAFLDSVQIMLDEANKRFPEAKKYLWGHSMGGAIVVNFLLRRNPKINGAVATGPLFKLAFAPPAFKVFLASMMKNIYPAFTENAEVDSAAISRDAAEVKKYNEDPYNHGKITAGTFFGFFEAGQWALGHAGELKTPLLLMHGTADRLTSPEGTKEFAAKAPKNLVTLKLWDGYYHELHNEPEPDRTAAINFLISWLDKH
jgi:alpha-beta hydrolase superfamily lysophospholipase